MMIRDLIKELEQFPQDAEVTLPIYGDVEFVTQVDDRILTDGSSYPVVMLQVE